MNSKVQKIIQEVNQGKISPIYVLDGDENYYLDLLTHYFEHNLMPDDQKDFNQTVIYGKDVSANDIINACLRYPMFAERQLIIVKDAAQIKDFNNLQSYIEKPMSTTVLVLEHRGKKLDARSKITKTIQSKAVTFTAEKVKEDQIPQWIANYAAGKEIKIQESACQLLAGNLGSDLQKIAMEVDKVAINLKEGEMITDDMVAKFTGISKEYNLFELPEVLASGNIERSSRMIHYFLSNSKNAPHPLVFGTFYNYFNQLHLATQVGNRNDKDAGVYLKTWGPKVAQLKKTAAAWGTQRIEIGMMILAKYSAASVGINHTARDTELLKEFFAQIQLLVPQQ